MNTTQQDKENLSFFIDNLHKASLLVNILYDTANCFTLIHARKLPRKKKKKLTKLLKR